MAEDDIDPISQHALGTLSTRVAEIEKGQAYLKAKSEEAENERRRQGREISDFRTDVSQRFQKLEELLEPLAVMGKAQKMAWGWIFASIAAIGTVIGAIWGLILIAEKVIKAIRGL
ncbi:hypothetical protein [Amorphus orientalis]|uniref:ABC-type multidrug transport system fused ATPase/permease subunit n=1 Tax=Amorphus orientalis TaxID=649198 RepID=A0AAE3VNE1_9HYPH|nr:hypothetical protein [Amorphus orientalis]MDQ0314871.1 ABC-type multidrug transport system fused ATPase/permease subunit [Amorphus orientalis]